MDKITEQKAVNLTIVVNGQTRTAGINSTVTDLLQGFQVTPSHVVVQLDGAIVPREAFAHTTLHEGSELEIVTLVGGG